MINENAPSRTLEYRSWYGMIQRCYNPKHDNYHRYGGRGIQVCNHWQQSFKNFLTDMGPRPTPRHSIDRIDNDGHYEPGNCRWATIEEQSNNKSTTLRVKLDNGETVTSKQLRDRYNLTRNQLYSRLANNIPLTQPSKIINKEHLYQGKLLTYKQLSDLHGIPISLIRTRISAGMPVEVACSKPVQLAKLYLYNGEPLSISDIAEIENVPDYLLRRNINKSKSSSPDIKAILDYIKRNHLNGERTDKQQPHGLTGTPEHKAWCDLIARCYSPGNQDYKTWGAKGVTVSDRWRYSFPKFLEDMGYKPSPKHRLKVLDKTKPIGLDSCIWFINSIIES